MGPALDDEVALITKDNRAANPAATKTATATINFFRVCRGLFSPSVIEAPWLGGAYSAAGENQLLDS